MLGFALLIPQLNKSSEHSKYFLNLLLDELDEKFPIFQNLLQ